MSNDTEIEVKHKPKSIEAPNTVVYILKVGNLAETTFPIVTDKGKKVVLKAVNNRIELDKKADKDVIAIVDAYIKEKGTISPIMLFDEFQLSLMSQPVKVEIDGKFYEVSKEAIVNAIKDSEELEKIKKAKGQSK